MEFPTTEIATMRAIKSLADVQIVLNKILNRNDQHDSSNVNRKGLRLINNGDAVDPQDYVTLKQLQSSQIPATPGNDYFSIPFSKDTVVAAGDLTIPYNPGIGRTGQPYQVILDALVPPVTSPLTMNFQINGLSILAHDISFPVGGTAAVTSSDFIQGLPMLSVGCRLVPLVTAADGQTANVTITLLVQKQ